MKLKIFAVILVFAVLDGGCVPPAPGASAVDPTLVAQVAATVHADVALTAAAQPTATSAPTYTPLPTYTPYPTYTPQPTETPVPPTETSRPTAAPSLTPTPTPQKWACTILSSSPAAGAEYGKSVDFDATFTVKNTGTQPWISSDLDIIYVSGEKTMVKTDLYDLKKNVDPGNSVDLLIDYMSPASTGDYRVEYDLKSGDTFCPLVTTIKVK